MIDISETRAPNGRLESIMQTSGVGAKTRASRLTAPVKVASFDETSCPSGNKRSGRSGSELILNPSQVVVVASRGPSGNNCNGVSFEKGRQQEQRGGQEKEEEEEEIRPSRKRYFILLMFVLLQVVKSFQWICLASITNVVAKFYRVDNLAINWTTILFMVTFLILALPVSWIMDSIGLRRSVLIGTLGVTLGVSIKCFTCHRDGFPLSMLGHLIVGISEPFFFSSYAQVASVWFPDDQVALATASSLIGEQTGLALGFIIPPLVIGRDPDDFEAIQRGLFGLFLVVAVLSIANTISIVLFFDEEPRCAPGIARYKQKRDETSRRQSQQLIWLQQMEMGLARARGPSMSGARTRREQSLRRASTISRVSQSVGEQVKLSAKFMTNRHFILLLVGFGINQGISYSTHTLLNQMIVGPSRSFVYEPPNLYQSVSAEQQFPLSTGADSAARLRALTVRSDAPARPFEMKPMGEELEKLEARDWTQESEANLVVGNAGLILILSGLIGSGLCGFVLDKWHKYKLTTVCIYILTLMAMAALTACLLLESPTILYLAIIPLGFAQTGYASCAFDYGVELTYPKPELLSSTLLNMSAQIFGVPISLVGSLIVDTYGSQALGAFFCAALALGFFVTCLQGGELRRQTAVNERCDQDKLTTGGGANVRGANPRDPQASNSTNGVGSKREQQVI